MNETFSGPNAPPAIQVPGGPFVRVAVVGASLTVGGAGAGGGVSLGGNFFFDRSLQAGGNPVTRFAVSNLMAAVGGVTIENGQGAFVVTSGGIAGFVAGKAQATGGGFSAGADVGLRVNKTGAPVHETIDLDGQTLAIDFDTGADTFALFGSARINVADFVTIEGNFSITNGELGASGASLFLGQGPARLDDGSINPSARGILLTDATFGLLNPAPGQFALYARGTIQVLGIPGLTLDGSATIRVNNTGLTFQGRPVATGDVNNPIYLNFSTTDNVFAFEGTGLTLSLLGQTIAADIAFSKATAGGSSVLAAIVSHASLSLGNGSGALVSVQDAGGSLLLDGEGVAGSLAGTVTVAAGTGLTLDGTFAVVVNTTASAINTTLTIGSTNAPLNVPAGPFLRVAGQNVAIVVAGQRLEGAFAFERMTDDSGAAVVTLAFTNVGLTLGGTGANALVTVSRANGLFLLTGAGLAGRVSAMVSVNPSTGVALGGRVPPGDQHDPGRRAADDRGAGRSRRARPVRRVVPAAGGQRHDPLRRRPDPQRQLPDRAADDDRGRLGGRGRLRRGRPGVQRREQGPP